MANSTDPFAESVHGTNPQYLVEKITRLKIYNCDYWKEQCFGLTSETIIDKAVVLKYCGGTYGGNIKPTEFLCLTLKLLQLQPEKDIVIAFIQNEDFKYLRLLGAVYMRLVGKAVDIYKYLEPLYNDYRKVSYRGSVGWSIKYIDEIIDALLNEELVFDIALPHLPKRMKLEDLGILPPRKSALDVDINEYIENQKNDENNNQVQEDSKHEENLPIEKSNETEKEEEEEEEEGEKKSDDDYDNKKISNESTKTKNDSRLRDIKDESVRLPLEQVQNKEKIDKTNQNATRRELTSAEADKNDKLDQKSNVDRGDHSRERDRRRDHSRERDRRRDHSRERDRRRDHSRERDRRRDHSRERDRRHSSEVTKTQKNEIFNTKISENVDEISNSDSIKNNPILFDDDDDDDDDDDGAVATSVNNSKTLESDVLNNAIDQIEKKKRLMDIKAAKKFDKIFKPSKVPSKSISDNRGVVVVSGKVEEFSVEYWNLRREALGLKKLNEKK
jgi:pre-mRNA-splicing factor 38A